MKCPHCQTHIPDEDLTNYNVSGRSVAINHRCPQCRKKLGSIKITEDQYSAYYHGIHYDHWRLVKYINHRAWIPEETG